MIIRIVRLTLQPDAVAAFDALFAATSPTIRAFPGCRHLELLADTSAPAIRTTYSLWADEASLEAYRSSDYFRSVWRQTKPLFAEPAVAHSYRSLCVVDA
ncbi:MAG: antibiotic biosynthesis monooxygenase [Rhodothermales bacterium]